MSSSSRSGTTVVGKPWAFVAGGWGQMVPRERRLVAGLAGAVALVVVVVIALLVSRELARLRETNAATREALAAIDEHRDTFLAARARMLAQEARIGREAPQLAADLEAAARAAGFQITQVDPQPTVPAGPRHREHAVTVTLREVELLAVSKFLSTLETGRRVVAVTRLFAKPSFAAGDKVDVTLTATAWERIKETRQPGTGPVSALVPDAHRRHAQGEPD
jgi:type II secretory pathway component PulM